MIVDRDSAPDSIGVWLAIGGVVVGGLLAGVHDITSTWIGFLSVMMANFAAVLYLTLIKRARKQTGLGSFELAIGNAQLSSLPLALVFAGVMCSVDGSTAPFMLANSQDRALNLTMATLLGATINFAIYWNSSVNGALAQTFCGVAKSTFTVIAGWGFMYLRSEPGFEQHMNYYAGILLCLTASAFYGLIKFWK